MQEIYKEQVLIHLEILKLLEKLNDKAKEANQEYLREIKKLHKLD